MGQIAATFAQRPRESRVMASVTSPLGETIHLMELSAAWGEWAYQIMRTTKRGSIVGQSLFDNIQEARQEYNKIIRAVENMSRKESI